MKFMVVLVVLLALQTPTLALGRFEMWKPLEHVSGDVVSGDVRERSNLEEGIEIKLLQYHQVDSPYATPNLTLSQRVVIAVKSSDARLQFFQKQIFGESFSDHNTNLAYRSPVYSDQLGSYLMQLNLGTPSRKFVANLDTGSDLVWVQCAKCTQCYTQTDPIFVPSASSTYKPRSCHGDALCSALPKIPKPCSAKKTCLYEYAYGDRSTTQGDFASETVTFTSSSGSKHHFTGIGFGCGHSNQGLFAPADGLVGFGQGPLSLPSQLGSQINHLFSYCLVGLFSAPTKTSNLLLGATGSNALHYTPLITNNAFPTFYYLPITGILVEGVSLVYPPAAFAINSAGQGGLILDSGTTISQLDSRAYTPFVNRIASLITYPRVDLSKQYSFDFCYNLSGVSNPTVPAVVFQFKNLNVDLPPNNIFIQVDDVPDICLAFRESSGFSIFGNFQQQNFQVAFDRANKRVGFAPKTC